MKDKLIITPRTKIGEMLDAYPELEEPLTRIAPAFKKLKNPILRKTIAKITSIEQAAKVGEINVGDIVNEMRKFVGQDELALDESGGEKISGKPVWLDESKIIMEYDAREEIAQGGHPLGEVLGFLPKMKAGDIYLLITPFYPAPLIDNVKAKGLQTWSGKEAGDIYKNYFYKI